MRLATTIACLLLLSCQEADLVRCSGCLDEVHERSRDLLAMSAVEVSQLTIAMEAIHQERHACAVCVLDSLLDSEMNQARDMLSDGLSEPTKGFVERDLAIAGEYRKRYPRDAEACRGVCVAPE